MIFTTALFVFAFLPIFLGVYYLLPFRFRSAWILAGSWVFYGWWRVDFLFLLVAMTMWNYAMGRVVSRRWELDEANARRGLVAGTVLNLGVLGYFKYFNFGVESLNGILSVAGVSQIHVWSVVLPIGISFYTFQATSYLVDVYRGDCPPAARYVDLGAYISLFPQLIAGPIIRYKDLRDQLSHRRHSLERFSRGAVRFMGGFCKKVLIADTVATIADAVFAMQAPHFVDAWLGAAAYTVQLYFDFSGYSDMAIGLGLMMGFRFPENFDFPYISRSITEFWRRWHISLSTWLRDYLYIPLGGNRKGVRRTYVNLMTVMVLGGLWHGAAWTFVLWGAWHGAFLAAERAFRGSRLANRVPKLVGVLGTMLVVIAGWVTFRAANLGQALAVYRGMLGINGFALSGGLSWQLPTFALATLSLAWGYTFLEPRIARAAQEEPGGERRVVWAYGAVIPLFLLGVAKVLADSYSPFLYFQF
jgi:alginate O-acetyltransferase complex protein AlgI